MALEIKNKKIVGTMDNLQEKLNGELPIDRLELIYLVNSWGRKTSFYNKDIYIESCEATQSEQALLVRKECYELSKLDVSQITNMESIFMHSKFNGDISNWDVSSVTYIIDMFKNSPLKTNPPSWYKNK